MRRDTILLDCVFMLLVFATFGVAYASYSSRMLAQERSDRERLINSLDDVMDSFIVRETEKARFLIPLIESDSSISDGAVLSGISSAKAIYNVDREMRVNRILYSEHPNKNYLENIHLTPRQIRDDIEQAMAFKEMRITKLHSSVATGKYSFSFLFPHENGILIAEVDLENILDILRKTGLLNIYRNSTVLLINPLIGQVFYSSDPETYPFMQFSPSDPEIATVGGEQYYYSKQKLKSLDLMLVVLTPRHAFESFVLLMKYYLYFLLACLCIYSLSRWYWTQLAIVRPFSRFLDRIKAGSVAGPPISSRYSEWLELERAYDQAWKSIESSAAALKSAHDFLTLVIDALPAIVLVLDSRGRITHWNQQARRFASHEGSEPPSDHVTQVFGMLAGIKEKLGHAIAQGESDSWRGLPVQRSSSTFYYDILFSPISSTGQDGGVLAVFDVTINMRRDLQFQQAQKMELVGNLAGGLAHDFNNLLGGISNSAEMMAMVARRTPLNEEKLSTFQRLVSQSVARAADMVQQLLTLSRKREMDLRQCDLKAVLTHVVQLCERTLPASVTVKTEFPDCAALAKADAARLEQVFLNLLINASHAMTSMRPAGAAQGGVATISIRSVVADKLFRARHAEASDCPYWIVSISDTGVGMTMEVAEKIFEPFFTTKANGTGLGLAMAYNIIKHHSGFIDIYSEPDQGSTFSVFLPHSGADAIERVAEHARSTLPLKGEGHILLADDDEAMRTTAKEFLQECGYKVTTAENGSECVNIYAKAMDNIDAVLLDMVMPVMCGKDAYIGLHKLNPKIKVILCSGFKQDERVLEILKLGAVGFVQKPYSLYSLSAEIKKAVLAAQQEKDKGDDIKA